MGSGWMRGVCDHRCQLRGCARGAQLVKGSLLFGGRRECGSQRVSRKQPE